MPTLIACLSSGKGTWTEVNRLIQSRPWTKIFLITDKFGQEKFITRPQNLEFILIDNFQEINTIITNIKKQLQNKVSDFEIALNFASGSGKEHMAILEAVLEMGLNFRLLTLDNNQVEVLGLKADS
ncbi:hypothetical protein J4437_04720 [Candidatus Woesearchaeota archaeon]|nr:hypothetical protein [Candidatus Woesearchaeota archaeon]